MATGRQLWGAMFLALALLAGPAQGADRFEEFLEEFKRERAQIDVLEARFVQHTMLPDEVLENEGTLLYARPGRIVFHMDAPGSSLLIDGRRAYEYDPDIKQVLVYDIDDNPQANIFYLGFDGDLESLAEVYDIRLFTIPDDPDAGQGVSIQPYKDREPDIYFEEVSLYLRAGDLLPYRIHIVNDRDSEVVIEIDDFTVNAAPPPERTQLTLAEGVKIIEQDRVRETVGPEGLRIPAPAIIQRRLDAPEMRPDETGSEVSP